MNLIIQLSPESESKLKEQAARHGKDVVEYAQAVLEDGLADEAAMSPTLANSVWHARFDALLQSLPSSNAKFLDDSRESIYLGRGE